MSAKGQTYVFQNRARAPFLSVHAPAKIMNKGSPLFSATVLLEPNGADAKGLKEVLIAVAKEAFPGRDLKTLKFPLVPGDAEAEKSAAKGRDGSFFRGHLVLKATSNEENPPGLAVMENGKVRDIPVLQRQSEGQKLFYNGCYVALAVYVAAYKNAAEGGVGEFSGVKAYLNHVLWLGDGPRIGGRATAEIFSGYAGTVTDKNPYTDSDESPF